MESLGSAMMEEFPPTVSTSCPGRYCTSAPLLPGMLSGLPARRAQVQVSRRVVRDITLPAH